MKPICEGVMVKLVGEDGNAFSIMCRVTAAMKKAGVQPETINEFRSEAMSGDYGDLLRTCAKYVECT